MKFGLRTPSLKKSISARTTGRVKRVAKKHLSPDTARKEWAGSKILKRRLTVKRIIRHHLV